MAAVAITVNGEERLAVVAELRRTAGAGPDEVLSAVRGAIAEEHELRASRVLLVNEGRLPAHLERQDPATGDRAGPHVR